MDDVILAIIGTCSNYQYLQDKLDDWINTNGRPDQILSGESHLVERYAYEHKIPIICTCPDQASYGKSAEIVRYRKMLREATHLIAFIDKSMNEQRALDHLTKELNVLCTRYYS